MTPKKHYKPIASDGHRHEMEVDWNCPVMDLSPPVYTWRCKACGLCATGCAEGPEFIEEN